MYFEIITPAKSKQDFLLAGEREYFKRIRQSARIELHEINHKLGNRPVPEIITGEGELILKKVRPGVVLVALDETGQAISSQELARIFEKEFSAGASGIAFAIGGPHGLSSQVQQKAKYVLSLSRLTFTAQFARFILAEQIYRALAIRSGSPYHKE